MNRTTRAAVNTHGGFWHFDEGAGTEAGDIHGVLLQLTNAAWVAGHSDDN